MRLLTVELRNFGCFLEADVDLRPATVIVGPNDSGKTTLMRAIRSLFTATDAGGRPFDYWSVKSTPLYAEDYLEDTRIVGTFGDLSQSEVEEWGDLCTADTIRGGTYFRWQDRDGELPGVRCIVLTAEYADTLLTPSDGSAHSFVAWLQEQEDSLIPGQTLLGPQIRLLDGEVWIPWDVTGTRGTAKLRDLGWASPILSRSRMGRGATIIDQIMGSSPFLSEDNLIHIRGPEQGVPSALDVVRPIIRRLLAHSADTRTKDKRSPLSAIDVAIGMIHDASDAITDAMDARYATALERYIGHSGGVRFTLREEIDASAVLDLIVSELSVALTHTRPGDPEGWDAYSIHSLGAGAQRAAALAALELHTDPDLWDPSDWLLLLIEEPEVGLYPQAQRRLATALRELPRFGVQVVTATHSPALVDSVSRDAIRVAEPGIDSRVVDGMGEVALRSHSLGAVEDIQRVTQILGCSPSDILLSRRVVLVEGPSDAAILKIWARTNGGDLDSVGVTVLPVGGFGPSRAAIAVMTAVLPGTAIEVVLDNGADTRDMQLELRERFDPRTVRVRLLRHTEIEKFFTADSIARWLELAEPSQSPSAPELQRMLDEPKRKRALRRIAEEYLGREYRVVEDGVAIAGQMRESELDASLRTLLTELSE